MKNRTNMPTKAVRAAILTICLLMAGVPASVKGATSVSRHGVTWTFDRNYTTGTYANGDPWVVGPVVITNITPRPTSGRNGSVLNPGLGTSQGFDSRLPSSLTPYVDSLNVGKSLPLSLPANSSLVSTISASNTPKWGVIQVFTVLTVVQTAPAPGSFRPCYIGAGSRASRWNKGAIRYDKLNRLSTAALGTLPNWAEYESVFEKCWFESNLFWTGRYLHTPYQASDGYGKKMAIQTGDVALLLNLDYSDAHKEKLLINFVQYGLDIAGIRWAGGRWYDTGGHNVGRLAPLLVAGTVLDDSDLKALFKGSQLGFSEYCQTFFVTQADVNRSRYTGDGRPRLPYRSSDIGLAEWGETHTDNPSRDGNNWNAFYRDICGSQLTAPAMAARVMGVRSVCNWEAMFKYADRHINYEQGSTYRGEFNSNPTTGFHKRFYNAHKNVTGPVPTGPDTTPPSISNISAVSTSTTVTITWSTNEASSSRVDHGTNTSYGASMANPDLVASHSMKIEGLNPQTTYQFRVASTDGAGNTATSGNGSFTTMEAGSDPVSPPVIIPTQTAYLTSVEIAISSETPGAIIHHTLDGSLPTTSSPVYVGPITLTEDTTVKAIAVRQGMADSTVSQAVYQVGGIITSDDQWINFAIPNQTQSFEFSYDVLPQGAGVDAVIGLSTATATGYGDLAAIVRFSGAGLVEARNGGVYSALNPLAYQAGLSYRVELSIDLPNRTYSVTVTPAGGAPVVIALDYAFRSEQSNASSLGNLAMVTSQGTAQLANVDVGSGDAGGQVSPPIFTPAAGEYLEPVSLILGSATLGAVVRYTTDGSEPGGSSQAFGPGGLTLSGDTTIKAMAMRAGMTDSTVSSADFVVGGATAGPTWKDYPLALREEGFVVGFDFTGPANGVTSLLGFSEGPATAANRITAGILLKNDREILALNGSVYESVDEVAHSAGTSYHMVASFDTERRRYTVVMQPVGQAYEKVAINWKLNLGDGEELNGIGNLGMLSIGGDLRITNFRVNHPSDVALFPRRPQAVREE